MIPNIQFEAEKDQRDALRFWTRVYLDIKSEMTEKGVVDPVKIVSDSAYFLWADKELAIKSQTPKQRYKGEDDMCPFCGSDQHDFMEKWSTTRKYFAVACLNCRAQGPEAKTKKEALEHFRLGI
jgi:hypothetical protein